MNKAHTGLPGEGFESNVSRKTVQLVPEQGSASGRAFPKPHPLVVVQLQQDVQDLAEQNRD